MKRSVVIWEQETIWQQVVVGERRYRYHAIKDVMDGCVLTWCGLLLANRPKGQFECPEHKCVKCQRALKVNYYR
jgi:hypothetical protein